MPDRTARRIDASRVKTLFIGYAGESPSGWRSIGPTAAYREQRPCKHALMSRRSCRDCAAISEHTQQFISIINYEAK